jgi:hypothetical protein
MIVILSGDKELRSLASLEIVLRSNMRTCDISSLVEKTTKMLGLKDEQAVYKMLKRVDKYYWPSRLAVSGTDLVCSDLRTEQDFAYLKQILPNTIGIKLVSGESTTKPTLSRNGWYTVYAGKSLIQQLMYVLNETK